MEAKPKSASRNFTRDNFLVDAVRPHRQGISYADGFRLGVGFIVAQLLVGLVVGGLAWGFVALYRLH